MTTPRRPRWLILAHAFNMDGRAASHTITDKIPYLLAEGIELVVLSGVTGEHDTRFEHHQLWSSGPSGLRFELRHVLRQRLQSRLAYRLVMLLASLLLMPAMFVERLFKPVESSWSWCFSAHRRAKALAAQRPFDLIYSTGGAFAAHLAGQSLQRALGVPWMAEIHDPMVLPGTTPRTRRQKAYADVEARICRHADLAIWFTDAAMASGLRRHPELTDRGRVMLPGVDRPFSGPLPPYTPSATFVLGHFGSLSPTRTFLPFIEAIALLREQAPEVYASLEVHIYGGQLDEPSAQRAQALGVADRIRRFGRLETDPVTGVSGRDQVLARMRQCDVLALVHGDDPMCEEYIPSKLYEYLWMQRPIVATVHDNPQMADLIRAEGHLVATSSLRNGGHSTQTADELSRLLHQLWQRWRSGGLADSGRDSPYTTQASTQQLIAWAKSLTPQRP